MAGARATADFYDAEMLTVFWETKPEIVARLVPAPLEPADLPIAMAFGAWYPATNFAAVYRETALFIRVKYQGEEGSYCLAMPVTSDMAMAGGREVFGFPKNMADIHYSIDGDAVHGWTERRGVRFMEIRASLTGKCNDEGLGRPSRPRSPWDSPYDPWSEVEVVRTLGAMYTKGDNFMLGGRVVAEVDPIRFAPYAFLKWDMK
jgi:acetoacetate decarboxylase